MTQPSAPPPTEAAPPAPRQVVLPGAEPRERRVLDLTDHGRAEGTGVRPPVSAAPAAGAEQAVRERPPSAAADAGTRERSDPDVWPGPPGPSPRRRAAEPEPPPGVPVMPGISVPAGNPALSGAGRSAEPPPADAAQPRPQPPEPAARQPEPPVVAPRRPEPPRISAPGAHPPAPAPRAEPAAPAAGPATADELIAAAERRAELAAAAERAEPATAVERPAELTTAAERRAELTTAAERRAELTTAAGRRAEPTLEPPTTTLPSRRSRRAANVPAATGKAGRNLPVAIGVGVVLGAVALAALLTRKEAFVGLASLAIVVAAWEISVAFSAKQVVVPVIPLAVGSLGMLVSAYVAGEEGLLVSFTLTAFGMLLWRIIDGLEGAVRDVAASVFAAAYLPFLAGFALLMLAQTDGRFRVLTFLAVCVASDVGGYAVGSLAGRHRLAPTISPKKSWEGLFGSGLACLIVGGPMVMVLLGGTWMAGALLGIAMAITATLGDLAESLLKRDLGIKDMGSLLPGHGGVMDRLDSLLISAPIAYLLLTWMVPPT